MKNIVSCKICGKEFDYSPGRAGNARQWCNKCRKMMDDQEVKKLKEEMTKEKNRYLIGAPKRKDEYDSAEILLEGVMPNFNSDADRFVCAMEVATFIRSTGITGLEDNLVKFLDILGSTHNVLFAKQITLQNIEAMAQDKRFKSFKEYLIKLEQEN